MPQKRVSALAAHINAAHLVAGDDQLISSITNDSRLTQPGSLYAALPGEHLDGHDFIDSAVAGGAKGILCSRVPEPLPAGVAIFRSTNPRLALSELANVFYDRPSDELEVVGVTGTDGKTSTVYFMHQLLEAMGESSAFLSTAGMQIGEVEQANLLHQSTPESPVVHKALSDMVISGNRYAILESTSHGLSGKTCRLAHVAYRAAVLTNLTHEHLEFHGSYGRYRDDKANLFRALDSGRLADRSEAADSSAEAVQGSRIIREWNAVATEVAKNGGRFGVVNLGCSEAPYFAGATRRPVFGYGTGDESGAIRAAKIRPDATGSEFVLRCGDVEVSARLGIPGVFNVENALAAALTVALLTGCDPAELSRKLPALRPVRGRMSVVQSEPFAVVVDYAHTPGSFERVLPFFREHTSGKLLVVFGSAGERDRAKRPIQGELASRYADTIILTDEDPRREPRMQILDEIASGCPGRRVGADLRKIPDRQEAIAYALAEAQPGDTVLLLGKGHETSIIGADAVQTWNEEGVARAELARLGF